MIDSPQHSLPEAAMHPPDPQFEQRVRESFAEQRWMQSLGARLVEVAPGRVSIELSPRPELSQQDGYVHAGVVTSIADSACGYAAHSTLSVCEANVFAGPGGERHVALMVATMIRVTPRGGKAESQEEHAP